jgi:hypothetical protein
MLSRLWRAVRTLPRHVLVLVALAAAAGIALGTWIGWELSVPHEFPILELFLPRLVYAPLAAITIVGALVWLLGGKWARFLAFGGLAFGLSIGVGQLVGPKWQPGQELGGGALTLRLDAPISQEFRVEAGCGTYANSDAISSVYTVNRIDIDGEHVEVLILPDSPRSGLALIRTPPSTLPTYGTNGRGSVEYQFNDLKTVGHASFLAVIGPRDAGPPLGGDGPRELRGSVDWTCGHEPIE